MQLHIAIPTSSRTVLYNYTDAISPTDVLALVEQREGLPASMLSLRVHSATRATVSFLKALSGGKGGFGAALRQEGRRAGYVGGGLDGLFVCSCLVYIIYLVFRLDRIMCTYKHFKWTR